MSVFKRNSIWYIEFEAHGLRIRRSAQTKNRRDAEDYERQLRREIFDQVILGKPIVEAMTIRQAVERYITTHLKPKKQKRHTAIADVYMMNRLIDLLGGDDTPIKSITAPAISHLKETLLRQDREPATVNRYLAVIKAILNKANKEWGN